MKKYLIIIAAIIFFAGCKTGPQRENYSSEEGFMFADCMDRNKENHDKSICTGASKAWEEQMKEKRKRERWEYCRDHCPKGMTESECRSSLNEK